MLYHGSRYCAVVGRRVLTGHDIVSILDDTGLALATTAAAHGLTETDPITLSGTTGYDGAETVGVVPSATTFYLTAPYSADSFGGRWD
jgi:hypothetical protein